MQNSSDDVKYRFLSFTIIILIIALSSYFWFLKGTEETFFQKKKGTEETKKLQRTTKQLCIKHKDIQYKN